MRSRLFRILGFGGLAVFMGMVACLGCALPRFANAENAIVSAESGNLSSAGVESVKEIVPSADDEVVYTTSQGLAVKKQNATLYMTINGMQYEVVGQGNGADKLETVSGYTDLEYIQSTGTQYINTTYTHTANTRLELKVFIPSSQPKTYPTPFGSRRGDVTPITQCLYTHIKSGFVLGAATAVGVSGYYFDEVAVLSYEGNVLSWTNGTTSKSVSNSGTPTTGACPLYLFTMNQVGGNTNDDDITNCCCAMSLYSCKIWDKGNLVRDFIPVKNSTGTVGLYDKVNSNFHTNIGSGSFTAGPNKILAWANASTYADSSPAASAISNDSNNSKRKLNGVPSVAGCAVGYLVVKNGANYLKVRI